MLRTTDWGGPSCDQPSLDLGQIPYDTTWREREPPGKFAALLHFIDRAVSQRHHLPQLMASDGFSDSYLLVVPHALRASALFIDEAHHIGAPTWARFRGLFTDREPPLPIVQFTATPFREDGRRVDGEFIYTYPLKKAQAEGYFKPIRFEAVVGLDQADADFAIAEKLGEVLQGNLDAGLNHLAMARCQTIERAKDLHQLYSALYPELRPVIVHSQQPVRERRANLAALRRFDSRIIVCVDMLGEGFDLPELKIAALHDPRKSIAVTIQFVGRFR